MKYHYDIIQGSEEWLKIKELKLSASSATAIGNQGKGLITLVTDLVLDHILPEQEKYYGKDMQRGNDLESAARTAYEFDQGVDVVEVGFVEHSEHCGVSPDGLVGEDGLVEFKARNNKIHYNLLKDLKIDSGTIWQVNMQMLVTERKWTDVCSYNPNFRQSLFIQRIYPNSDLQLKLEEGIKLGTELIKKELSNQIVLTEIK